MPLKPVGGEITSQAINEALSYLDTKQVETAQIPNNSLPSSKLRNTTDAEKIQPSNLSAAVISMMNGTSPTGTTPTDGSVTTVKLANEAVTPAKLGQHYISGYYYCISGETPYLEETIGMVGGTGKTYIKFSSVGTRNKTGGTFTKNWTQLKADLATAIFTTSPAGIVDCLEIPESNALVIDLATGTFNLINRLDADLNKYANLATNTDGRYIAGSLVQQHTREYGGVRARRYKDKIKLDSLHQYMGNDGELYIEERTGEPYVYFRHGSLRLIGYGVNVTRDWTTCKADIDDPTRVVTSKAGIADCMRLGDGEMYCYNMDTAKTQIIGSTSYDPEKHINLVAFVGTVMISGKFREMVTYRRARDIYKAAYRYQDKTKIDGAHFYIGNDGELYAEEKDYAVGLYIRHGELRVVGSGRGGTLVNVTRPWETCKTDINDPTRYVTSKAGVADCLRLTDGEMYAYNMDTGKVEITARQNYDPEKHVNLVTQTSAVMISGRIRDMLTYRKARDATKDVADLKVKIGDIQALPNWAVADLEATSGRVQSVQKTNTLTFGFITDTHYASTYASTKASLNHLRAISQLSQYAGLNFIVNGGDFTDGNAPKATTMADIRRGMKSYMEAAHCPVVTMKGNHDDNSIYAYYNGQKLVDMLSPLEWYNATVRLFERHVTVDPDNPTGGYFYMDDERSKVRTIMLDSLDFPYLDNGDGETPKYYPIFQYAYGGLQLEWLAHKALNFSDKPVPSDWATIIISHVPLKSELSFTGDGTATNADVVLGIIEAYKDGAAFTSTPTTGDFAQSIVVDYTAQGAGDLICCLFGHVHWDKIDVIDGITHVACLNSLVAKATSVVPGANVYDRTLDTDVEDAWTVFTVDRALRKVWGHRYGAGEDFEFTY